MLYRYVATDRSGKFIEGELEVDDVGQVLQRLAGSELRPISVRPVKEKGGRIHLRFGKITLADKIFLTRYLSLMLKVGTDLLSAITILIADFEKPAMKNFLVEIKTNLSRGQPFYQVFARYPKVFSQVFVNLVKAAEASGNLQQTFEELSQSLQKEAELQRRVRTAFIYPIILLVVAVAVFGFLSLFALPRIAKVFTETGIDPPTFSKVVFAIGLFIGAHVTALLIVAVVLIVGSIFFFGMTIPGRRIAGRALSRMPLVRQIYRDLAIQRFASTFSALMRAGLPIIQTTKITAGVVGYEDFKVSLIKIADEGLAKGLTVGESFRRETVFPKVIVNLIAVSEKAGHLEEVLDTVAEFYSSNVESSIRSLMAVLEPLILLCMGVLVGTVALAIIVPIYQLTSQF
jgi:type II secretory pathway component PulF